MSAFWNSFVILITLGSIVFFLWLLLSNARGTPGAEADHVWDQDLRENNNPLPRWWLNMFILSIVFALVYLVIYPGLGSFTGVSGWTQEKQLTSRLEAVQQKRQQLYASLKDKDVATLSKEPVAKSLGRDVFLNNCAGCHGADAQGAVGFPNLADHDWLYGGMPEAIVTSITSGRSGSMPPMGAAMQPEALDAVIALLEHWSDTKLDPAVRERGNQQFMMMCAACHGAEGKGNPMLGAPNLTDRIWLHGGSRERLRETLLKGRNSQMPAHEQILSKDEIRLVSAYVYGLSSSNEQ